jgi:drug/metabolite transporter (DMT)-like permease
MMQNPVNQIELAPENAGSWIGVGLLLLSALGFTIAMLFANMAYKDGIDVHTTNAARYLATVVFLFLFQKIRGKKLGLPPRERYTSLALGISVFMMGLGYLGATQYIPISLAVLLFYTFPVFVAVIARFTENESITAIRLIAIIIAFIGLGLAMEVHSLTNLNWQGVAFGFLSSLGCTTFVIVNSRSMRTADPQAVNFHCLAAGTVFFAAFLFFTGGPTGMLSYSALSKLCVSSLALAVGYVTLFTGLEIIGPVKTSMLMNAEPILTITLAASLLGERLVSIQLIGAALVILGIILITGGSKEKLINIK